MTASKPHVPARTRLAVVLAAALAAVATAVVPVLAHGGAAAQPIVERVPDVRGLEATGLVAFAPRIRVTNDSDTVVTVVDDSGVPWLQLSADGVFADLSVRAWSESLDSSGRGLDPDPSTPSAWTQVSVLPTWEWFDTDLLPRSDDDAEHTWSIPVVVDGQFDEITGVLVESGLQGRWATDLVGSGDVGAARLTAVSGPVPVFVVQRLDAEEVVVLGRFGEPLLRLTEAGFEVNLASPSWNDHARLDSQTEIGAVVEDPDADPVWEMRLAGAPTGTWLDTRAGIDDAVPRRRADTELLVDLPIVVDGVPYDVPVRTAWVGDAVPLLALRLTLPTLIAASLGAGLLAAGAVRLWERRRDDRAGDDDADDGDAAGPDADDDADAATATVTPGD